jgi:hypothetical protein
VIKRNGTKYHLIWNEDRDACFALRTEVEHAAESGMALLQEWRERHPVQRFLRALAERLG